MSVPSNFRYDISFLRAFSVLAVVLYHFKIDGFQGGFIGVDVFFVISGYLMTKIILTGFQKNTFDFMSFYGKRVTRIVPALLAMMLLVGLAIYILIPVQFLSFIRSASASGLFLSNIQYYLLNGYFSSDSQTNFLLHTWSLSVEWQFYILYPILLWPLKNVYLNQKRIFHAVFYSLIAISFFGMMIMAEKDASFSFYMFMTRSWEMLLGGVIFLLPRSNFKKTYRTITSIVCFLALSSCVIFIDEENIAWPSLWTIIPVISVSFLLWVHSDFKLYRTRIIQFLGDTSYSFYLWHWPIYVFSLFFGLNDLWYHKLVFIVLSFILAVISYYTVEQFRHYTHKNVAVITFSTIMVLLFVYFKMPNSLFINSETSELARTETTYTDSNQMRVQYNYGSHHLTDEQVFSEYKTDHLTPNVGEKNIILLGDSHAGMFADALKNSLPQYNIMQVTADAAFPIPHSDNRFKESVKLFNYFFETYFPKNYTAIDLVVISSNYVAHRPQLDSYLSYLIAYFQKYKVDYIFVGQTPTYAFNFPTVYYLEKEYDFKSKDNERKKRFNNGVNSYLKEKLDDSYIDILNSDVNVISSKGTPYLYDAGHLSYFGAQEYMPIISKAVQNKINTFDQKSSE